jgi:hypothetical protein
MHFDPKQMMVRVAPFDYYVFPPASSYMFNVRIAKYDNTGQIDAQFYLDWQHTPKTQGQRGLVFLIGQTISY